MLHIPGVASLAVLGSTFAVGARDHLIHLWSLETLQPLRKFQGHSDAVLAVESCQPLELLVSGGNDRSVRLLAPYDGGWVSVFFLNVCQVAQSY